MDTLQTWELLSYLVTVIGLPLAIAVFVFERRRERQNDQEEIFQRLSDEYREFLKLVLENSDLHLLQREVSSLELTQEQKERRFVI
jgi:lipopolysaccharide biosynthesis regulator YciM